MVQNRSFRRFERAGYKPSFREKDGQRFVTDMQNFIIDLALDVIEDPTTWGQEMDHVVGVRAWLVQPNGGQGHRSWTRWCSDLTSTKAN